MAETYIPLYIQKSDRTAFLACLGLGVLHAIRQGVLRPQAGIWTLGRPNVWMPLAHESDVPAELIRVFSSADELSAIQKLRPKEFEATVDELIGTLETILASTGEQYWLVTWSPPSGEEAVPPAAQK